MVLKPIKANMTVLEFDKDGIKYQVLFSYSTPVAYSKLTSVGLLRYKTNQWYSKTTSRHVSTWFHEYDDVCPQEEIDSLVAEGK